VRKTILGVAFFVLTPLALGASLFSLLVLSGTFAGHGEVLSETTDFRRSPKSGVQVYASLPGSVPSISAQAGTGDARPELIRQYLASYKSPLEPFANFIVEMADKYGIDYRLVTAIAQQESNLCKIIPPNTYNCWGWGVHSKGTLGFESYTEGIETVTKGIKEDYIDKGFVTTDDIMSKYTPLSPGSWAYGVDTFMQEMQ